MKEMLTGRIYKGRGRRFYLGRRNMFKNNDPLKRHEMQLAK